MDNLEKAKALAAEVEKMDAENEQTKPVEPVPPEPKVEVPVEQIESPEVSKEPKPENGERVERKVYSISLDKHNKQLENARKVADEERDKIRAEALQEAEAKYKVVAPDDSHNDVKSFSEEHGVDEAVVNKILDLAEKRISSKVKGIPEDMQAELVNLKAQREMQAAKQQFESEFSSSVLPLITKENPNATPTQIQEIKSRLDELAFSSKYNTYALADIFQVKSSEFDLKPTMSVESSRGGSRTGTVDFSNVSPEDLKKMSVQEADKYFQWEKSQSKGSKYY